MMITLQRESIDAFAAMLTSYMDTGLFISDETLESFRQCISSLEAVLARAGIESFSVMYVLIPYVSTRNMVIDYMSSWGTHA